VDDDRPENPVRWAAGAGARSALEVARAVVAVLEGSRGEGAAMATVIGRSGSAPQILGARLLLTRDGTLVGTVGGGAIEAQVLDACHRTLRDGQTRRIDAHLVRDLGMCCGGAMEVFVEYVQPEARLILIGAGHVAQALAPMARAASLRVTVVDDREEILEHPAFADCDRRTHDVDELEDALPDLTAQDFVVIFTRDHARDEQALTHLVQRPHRYLGMIGSRRKALNILGRTRARLEGLSRDPPDLSRVRAPVGLALGGRTPAEIAVSILAEVVALRHGGSGETMSCVDADASRVPAEDAP
jgi:xanthine dehydrogenase accessory factor